jgi:23S rRNA pseudouridine1911/1915/1917 synthase
MGRQTGLPGDARDTVHTLGVDETDVPSTDRLDRFLADRLDLSRTRIARLISDGRVTVNGSEPQKRYRPQPGDRIEVRVPAPRPTSVEPEDIPLEIRYEDDCLAVVEKPYGLVTHPAPGHPSGTLVNALLFHLDRLSTLGGDRRPGIVHRLDKDTSGLMVVAKTDQAHRALSEALARRVIRRGYVTAVWGHVDEERFTVERPIGRDPRDRKRMAVRDDGRRAVTHVKLLERWVAADLVAIRLQTGRTHQVRVHMRATGHPIVADPIYSAGWEKGFLGAGARWAGFLARRADRLFLHAAHLSLDHPMTGERLSFSSELPEPLASTVAWARKTSAPR